jgi:hypothetical protein
MNLDFQYVQDVERDGVMYDLQKADVTRCGEFWRFWRTPAADPLKIFMYIRPEDGGWWEGSHPFC